MTKATLLSTVLALAITATIVSSGRAANRETAGSNSLDRVVTVRVYNYAGVSEKTLASASRNAQAFYKRAGVDTRWIRCRTSLDEPVYDASCSQPLRPGIIQLRVLATAPKKVKGIHDSVYGYALPSLTGGFGNIANVFWDRVQNQAVASRVQASQLLGAALAHELGHLMLGVGSHAKAGLMTGLWNSAFLARIADGSISFLPREAKTLRKDAAARLRASR